VRTFPKPLAEALTLHIAVAIAAGMLLPIGDKKRFKTRAQSFDGLWEIHDERHQAVDAIKGARRLVSSLMSFWAAEIC
jgi:hypothetical protein